MDKVRVLESGLRSPKGPVFDEAGRLWCTEQEGEGLFCRDTVGNTTRFYTGGRPSGAAVRDGYIWFCDSGQQAIRRFHIESRRAETVLDRIGTASLQMPDHLLFDNSGNLLFTCLGLPDNNWQGYVAVYSTGRLIEIIADGMDYPNGLAFLPDNRALLINETHPQRIWQGSWDADELSWENISVWATVMSVTEDDFIAGPAGMTFGPDHNLYVVVSGTGLIQVFSPEGQSIRAIDLPGRNPTNCAFDPSGELGLVVTETRLGELLSITV